LSYESSYLRSASCCVRVMSHVLKI
jgi:hypothetical protein